MDEKMKIELARLIAETIMKGKRNETTKIHSIHDNGYQPIRDCIQPEHRTA